MEMEAEAVMLQRSTPVNNGGFIRGEALAWARLFDRRYIDRTLVGTVVMFFQREFPQLIAQEEYVKFASVTEWSGINALLYYGPLLMRSLGFNGNTVNLMVAGGVNIVQFLAVLPAILYIDRWGK
jgi:hypothetical protein